MAEVKFNYSEEQYTLLKNKDIEIKNTLNKLLFEDIDDKHAINELKDILLSYHMEDGGFMELVDLRIADANIDLATKNGKVVFIYVLGYSNTCAGTRTDLTKKDTADFKIDTLQNRLVFTLMDMEATSPDDEL